MSVSYRDAGVDIASADRLLSGLGSLIRGTHGPQVLPDRGQFAGLFRLAGNGSMRDPVLVSSTDGAGTKLKVAQLAGRHEGIGVDAVGMNVNDVLVYGAKPLFFLDYIAMGKLQPATFKQLVRGVVKGCRQAGCALIGGETAEMPGVYADGDYDIAGFCVGVADRSKLLDGSKVRAGDVVLGLASSGPHANGFSLIRKVFGPAELLRFQRELLSPTRIYVKPVLAALSRARIGAIAHVTGGGLSRRLPSLVAKQPSLRVAWEPGRWPIQPIFERIQAAGRISRDEMYATFNMGIGMVMTCRPSDAARVSTIMKRSGIRVWSVGTIVRRKESK